MWKLTKYLSQAAADKERYKRDMADYDAPAGSNVSQGKSTKKKKKDPNAPKRGQSSFMFFSNDVRAKVKEENPDLTFGALVSSPLRNLNLLLTFFGLTKIACNPMMY